MTLRKITFFIVALVIATVAASHRWGDSAHSMGLISKFGGKSRHPAVFDNGHGRRVMITTATVLPPFKGDVRLELSGRTAIEHDFFLSGPVIDFKMKEFPKLESNIIKGLKPKDRIALWVDMTLPPLDPVCGMEVKKGFLRHTHGSKAYFFCAQHCQKEFIASPDRFLDSDSIQGKYSLAMVDTKTGNSVLKIPIIFGERETNGRSGSHH